jgi:hypothetical protein
MVDPSLDLLIQQVLASTNDEDEAGLWIDGEDNYSSSGGASTSSIGSIPGDLFDGDYEFDDLSTQEIPGTSWKGEEVVAHSNEKQSMLTSNLKNVLSTKVRTSKTLEVNTKMTTFAIGYRRSSSSLGVCNPLRPEPTGKSHSANCDHCALQSSRSVPLRQEYEMLSFSLGYDKKPLAHESDHAWEERSAGNTLLSCPKDASSITRRGLLRLMIGGMATMSSSPSSFVQDNVSTCTATSQADKMTTMSKSIDRQDKPIATSHALNEEDKASPACAERASDVVEGRSVSPVRRSPSTGDMLHRICSWSESLKTKGLLKIINTLEHILRVDPVALQRPVALFERTRKYNPVSKRMETSRRQCPFRYPLFIALNRQDTPRSMVQVLIQHSAQRSLLSSLRDGPHQETVLHLLLRKRPTETLLMNEMIMADRALGRIQDRRGNTPLHVACQHHALRGTILHLSWVFPCSLEVRNINGKTPHDIALSRSTTGDDSVLVLLTPRSHRIVSCTL